MQYLKALRVARLISLGISRMFCANSHRFCSEGLSDAPSKGVLGPLQVTFYSIT